MAALAAGRQDSGTARPKGRITMRPRADGHEGAQEVRKSVGGTERFSESPAPSQAPPATSARRLSLSGDAAARAARTLGERLPAVAPRPAKAPAQPPAKPAPAIEAPRPVAPKLERLPANRNAAVVALEHRLRELAPAVIRDPPLPLAVGARRNIAALLAGEVSKKMLCRFLARWTRRAAYLRAVAAGGPRYDLVGQPAGTVTADQRETAAATLAERGLT